MRRSPVLLALAVPLVTGGCGAGGPATVPLATAHPVRVMSMNQCTDQLVLALLPPERIASVTWLSRDPRFSVEVAAARRVAVNHGGVEEVARTRPDLVVTDTFSNPTARALLHRLGYPMIEIADAMNADEIRRNVRALAAALDERARGETLIARMDRQLAPERPTAPVRVAAWDRDGIRSGPILDLVLTSAGAVDVGEGSGDVERLLVTRPTLLLDREADVRAPSLGDDRARHRLVRRLWGPSRRLRVPRASLFCATPAIGTAAVALRAQIAAFRRRGGGA